MTKPKHTPGPWSISTDHNFKSRQVVSNQDQLICELHYHHKEMDNNAQLIAAAPELLEACTALACELDYRDKKGEASNLYSEVVNKYIIAIKKVKTE